MGENEAVTQGGRPPAVRATLPSNAPTPVTVMASLAMAPDPVGMVRALCAGARVKYAPLTVSMILTDEYPPGTKPVTVSTYVPGTTWALHVSVSVVDPGTVTG